VNDPKLDSLAALAEVSKQDFANYQIKRLTLHKVVMQPPVKTQMGEPSVWLAHPQTGSPGVASHARVNKINKCV
jgi:hypothetical protein